MSKIPQPNKHPDIPSPTGDGPHRRHIVPGMAYFQRSGPDDTRCRGCVFAVEQSRSHLIRCKKYSEMMIRAPIGEKFDRDTPSCKFFTARPTRPMPMTDALIREAIIRESAK